MKYRVGIYDCDSYYAIGLMEYINVHRDFSIQSIAFTTEEALLRHKASTPFDLVLYAGHPQAAVAENIGCRIVRLSEVDEADYEGESYVFKYQRADVLVRHILSIVQSGCSRPSGRTSFYGVYSPVGRCGKTTFAFGICHACAGSLYVGMDSYIGSTVLSDELFRQSELFFYRLMTRNRQIKEAAFGGTVPGEVFSAVYGLRCFTDYKQLAAEDFQWFRQILEEEKTVSDVVLDIGAGVLPELGILSVVDRIFVPCLSDAYSMRRLEHFRLLMRDEPYRQIAERISYVEVPAEPYDSPRMQEYVRRKLTSG